MSTDFSIGSVGAPGVAFIDGAAASIVGQVVDSRTSMVVERYPDEAILRCRAYFHTLDLTRVKPTRLLVTDRSA